MHVCVCGGGASFLPLLWDVHVQVMEGLEEVEKMRRFMHYYERYKTHKDNLAVSRT